MPLLDLTFIDLSLGFIVFLLIIPYFKTLLAKPVS
jgi:hypothetical protein